MKSVKKYNYKNIVKMIAIKVAQKEVEAACPFISYQPRLPKAVLELKHDE